MIERLSDKQKKILRFVAMPQKYIICDGAVRTGKTIVMSIAFVLWAMENFDGCNFAICGKTVANAERNVLTPLIVSDELPYQIAYHRQERMMLCTMGRKTNRFYLFGGKDESSYQLIQGITLAGVLLDEVALMPKSFVEQALARTLTFDNAKIFFNCNPESQLHWFNQEWIIPTDEGKRNDAVHLHFLLRDNPIMSEKAIADTESMFSGVFYKRYILGEWVSADGLVYDQFDADRHVYEAIDTEGEYFVSCDYGIQNATVFLLWRKVRGDGSRWACVKEWYYSGRDSKVQKTNTDLVESLKTMLDGIKPKQVIVDPSASALIVELRRNGYHVLKAVNDVIDGIAEVSQMLQSDRLVFHKSCRNTIEEFSIYAWDQKASAHGEDKPLKTHDHAMDAVRYMVHTRHLAKEKKEYNGYY